MMMQPTLSAAAELQSILVRYDFGAMPPGLAARVCTLREILKLEFGADAPAILMTVDVRNHPDDRCAEHFEGSTILPFV